MSTSLIVTVVVLAAIAWLSFLAVSAVRSRGPEEIAPNRQPGTPDDDMETRRLERAQLGAVLLSAFLAIGLPLYYLSEPDRQESFVEQFSEESVVRGEHLVEEFRCWQCHGPDGVGGVASYVERRSGVTVSWAAPSLNDVFFRYGRDEVDYWITYGRGNSPMPAWGTAGNGPLNEQQVNDIVNYLETIQVPQTEAAAEVEATITAELQRLGRADETMAQALTDQRQLLADLRRAPELRPVADDLAQRAAAILRDAASGIDTDGDGVSDAAESAITDVLAEARRAFLLPGLSEIRLDPTNPATDGPGDQEAVRQALDAMIDLVDSGQAPILEANVTAVETALASGGDDGDGDGIPDAAEPQLQAQFADAVTKTLPAGFVSPVLDPTNPASEGGESDSVTASRAVSALESVALSLGIQDDNNAKLIEPAEVSLQELLEAQEERRWDFDLEAIAEQTFGGDIDRARQVVGIFNGYCARCHTAGYSAGIPYQLEPGSGGFGPALWDGRPAVQFLSDEDLAAFLVVGAEANRPYGVNGFGNGQMPGWGKILSAEELADLATWLRDGDLSGKGAPDA